MLFSNTFGYVMFGENCIYQFINFEFHPWFLKNYMEENSQRYHHALETILQIKIPRDLSEQEKRNEHGYTFLLEMLPLNEQRNTFLSLHPNRVYMEENGRAVSYCFFFILRNMYNMGARMYIEWIRGDIPQYIIKIYNEAFRRFSSLKHSLRKNDDTLSKMKEMYKSFRFDILEKSIKSGKEEFLEEGCTFKGWEI